ncbi:hypothetical protein K4K61_002416 [Colletotrichum sp. SAR11_59]|nr:hypothetical protein K4K61_002416 [Colletotrichum sp. SAR11_59]
MRQKQAARRLWSVLVASALGLIAYRILCQSKVDFGGDATGSPLDYAAESSPMSNRAQDFDNLHLTEEQCQETFPGLTKEIDLAVAQGSFQLNIDDASASLLGQIKNNKLLIIRAPRPVDMSEQWREELLKIAKDAKWANVQALEWMNQGEDAMNALNIEDFCRYKYIIHTEGVSYSGRLQFHQLCESVILSPPIEWMQHTTHLVKPVYSSTLLGSDEANSVEREKSQKQQQGRYPSKRAQETWPATFRPEEANMVFVNPDWSDLEATISWLENHADVAHGIAKRQRDLFAGRGYLSPAAEVCYWRALIRGWSQVVHADEAIWENSKVTPWEELSVRTEKVQQRS